MRPRSQAALVQLASFVLGVIVGPLWHLARHRPDHTHGPTGARIALRLPGEAGHEAAHRHPHGHPHRHSHARPHRHSLAHEHEDVLRWPAPTHGHDDHASDPDLPGARPALPPDHGHGSVAHLGLALLGTAPPLALPRPARRDVLPVRAATAELRLFAPSFPFPRPPPPPPNELNPDRRDQA